MSGQPTIVIKLECYRGTNEIARFLGVHPDHARKLLREGRVPAKKDGTGTWVLTNLDYFQSLQG